MNNIHTILDIRSVVGLVQPGTASATIIIFEKVKTRIIFLLCTIYFFVCVCVYNQRLLLLFREG